MNLGRYITRSAKYFSGQPAMIFEGKKISYEELDKRTNRLARGFYALGMEKGDRVAIQAWNGPEIAETEVACYKRGWSGFPSMRAFPRRRPPASSITPKCKQSLPTGSTSNPCWNPDSPWKQSVIL